MGKQRTETHSHPESDEPAEPPVVPATSGRWQWLRASGAGLLGAVSCLAVGGLLAVSWVETRVLTTDNWVAMVSPLPKNPAVATALGTTLGDKLFNAVPVEQRIAEVLPERASFLASPLSDQIHSLTNKAAVGVVGSDGFQTVWAGANRLAMDRVVSQARGETPPLQAKINERFNINLAGAGDQIRNALGRASEAIPALSSVGNGNGLAISADLQAKRDRLHQGIRTIDNLNAILPMLAIASLLLSLAIANRRRHTLMSFAIGVILTSLAALIALKWLHNDIMAQIKISSNQPAVDYIYTTIVADLRENFIWVALAAAALWVVCVAAGPAAWAVRMRSLVRLDALGRSRYMAWWTPVRQFIHRWEYAFDVALLVIVLAVLALGVDVTTITLTNALLVLLSGIAALRIIASPHVHEPLAIKSWHALQAPQSP